MTQLKLSLLKAGSNIHAGDGGYGIGTRENYEEFVKMRNKSLNLEQEEQTSCDKQGEPVGYIANKRQRLNVELKPNAIVWMPTTTDWELPLFTTPQPDQDEVDIRSRLYQRIHEFEDLLRDIAEYEGEGPSTTDWQSIVKLISDSARNALDVDPRSYGGPVYRYGDHPTSFGLFKSKWVELSDEQQKVCYDTAHDEDGFLDMEKLINLREHLLKENNT